MKLLTCATLITSASAFTPCHKMASSSALYAEVVAEEDGAAAAPATSTAAGIDFSKDFGALPPLGLWDPAGKLEGASQEDFDLLRLRELTHGRVAMLAFTGYITTLCGWRLPGCEDVPPGIPALSEMPGLAGIGLALTMGLLVIVVNDFEELGESEFPGDFRNGALDFGWDKFNDATKLKKRTIELNNGRAAMMGWTGLVVHEYMGNLNEIVPGLN